MKLIFTFVFTVLVILSANSCDLIEPTNSKPEYNLVNEIHIINADGTDEKIIANGWDSKIMKTKNKVLFKKNNSIYTVNYDGTNSTKLKTFSRSLWDFSLSGNESKIVLSLYSNASANLYLMDSDGSNFRRLTNDNNSADLDPEFSTDMNKIVFRRNWNICVLDLSTLNIQLLTNRKDSIYYRSPHFILNDSQVIYFEHSNEFNDLLVIHLYSLNEQSDKSIINIKGAVFNEFFFDISQNNKVIFLENHSLAEDSIKILDVSNYSVTNIAAGHSASFSNEGNEIVYSDGEKIFLIDTAGNNEREIYKEPDENKWVTKPQLSLRNDKIIFEVSYTVPIK